MFSMISAQQRFPLIANLLINLSKTYQFGLVTSLGKCRKCSARREVSSPRFSDAETFATEIPSTRRDGNHITMLSSREPAPSIGSAVRFDGPLPLPDVDMHHIEFLRLIFDKKHLIQTFDQLMPYPQIMTRMLSHIPPGHLG